MSSRTSALRIFAVLATTLAFAACDEKTVQPPIPTISITPNAAINLLVGQQATVSGVVTGLTTNAVTYSSSVPAVATVDANTGVVRAVSAGTTTVIAQSVEQPTLRASVQVNVTATTPPPPTGPPAAASVVISSITGLNGQQVDITNAAGQINVNLTVDVPVGTVVDEVQVLIDNVVVCTQAFTAPAAVDPGALSTDAAAAAVLITCPVNTAEITATGAPRFPNGPHAITARLRRGGTTTVATPSTSITFNNNSFISATVTTSRGPCQTGGTVPGPGNLAPAGSLWCAGDVTVTLTPSVYAVGGQTGQGGLSQVTVSLVSSGAGVHGQTGCQTTGTLATDPTIANAAGGAGPAAAPGGGFAPGGNAAANATPNCGSRTATQTDADASNGLVVVFPEANRMNSTGTGGNGVNDVEDVFAINIQSVTAGGQQGPVCVNPNPTTNPQNGGQFGTALVSCQNALGINPTTGQPFSTNNLLRLDNLAPRVTRFDITPAGCDPNDPLTPGVNCYINSPAVITNNPATSSSFQSVDYGVDSQTQTFSMGTTAANQAAVPATFTAANETPTSGTNFAAVTVVDKLGNSSGALFATSVTGNTVAGTVTGAHGFGIDITAPTCQFTDTPDVGFVLADERNPEAGDVFRTTFSDTSTPPGGPSGFPLAPVSRTQVRRTATSPTPNTAANCLVGTFNTTTLVCDPVAGGSDDPFNTPAAPNIVASPGLAADADGYATETVTVSDQAGNTCGPLTRTALDDDIAPTVGAISGPSIIAAGNNPVTFSAGAIDNVDLDDATLYIDYGGVVINLQTGAADLGSYGFDVFSTTATVTATDPNFIRSIETTFGTGAPNGIVTNASNAELRVRDVGGLETIQNTDIQAAVNAGGSFGSFTANNPNLRAFTMTSSQTTLCNGDTAGGTQTTPCPTNPTSTTLTATATGPQGTFANPFQRVNFYDQRPDGTTVLIGTGSVSVTDVTTPPGERRYSYTTTFTSTGLTAGVHQVFAIGVDSQGRGLASNVIAHNVVLD